ncbi:MAG: hypothetical protein ACN6OZ_04260 [Stenotrophomonas sp.]|jgi:hypothetical protein|uniref:hypothetical protein n=1 Tax=Stenotrophomonas indicatrix TaxID=2045451 RepID=UPI001055F2B0|nr:hypothetical protein [Stenotrophomonas indicatrix]
MKFFHVRPSSSRKEGSCFAKLSSFSISGGRRIHIHLPDGLNEFPSSVGIPLNDVIDNIQHLHVRLPLTGAHGKSIELNPCFGDLLRSTMRPSG